MTDTQINPESVRALRTEMIAASDDAGCTLESDEVAFVAALATAYLAQAEELAEARAEIERLRKALRRHHDWHLAQDRDGDAWGVDPVDAYSESGLCEETINALAAIRAGKVTGCFGGP